MATTMTTKLFRQGARRIAAKSSSTNPQSPWRGSSLSTAARLQSTQSYTSGGTVLHSEWIGSNDYESEGDNEHTIVFLHGLLGNGRNMQTMAKKMCASLDRPGLLVDLTGHGGSKGRNDPEKTVTFDTCLADIHATLTSAGIGGGSDDDYNDSKVTLVGHSLGGRLALQYAHEQYHDRLDHVWLLDTVPGQPHASVVQVLQIAEKVLEQQQWSGVKKKEVTALLMGQYGMDQPTAMWLASGFTVNKETGQAEFGFCSKTARDLVEGIGRQDFMYKLQQTVFRSASDHTQNEYNDNHNASASNNHPVRVDLVRGAKNTAWEASGHLPTLHNLMVEHKDQFGLHTVQAGHNVHVEDLPGLMQAVDLVSKSR
jgi:pimeloyl-ACP methyl ester carboxylesterase